MADFRTHLSAAVGGGVLLAVAGWQGGLWTPGEALAREVANGVVAQLGKALRPSGVHVVPELPKL